MNTLVRSTKPGRISSGRRSRLAAIGTAAVVTTGNAFADGSGNVGADAVITAVTGLVAVAAAVVAAAVLVVVVPWGAKMAVRAFKAIGGA